MVHQQEGTFKPARVAVVTVSDTRNEATDKSGSLIVSLLEEKGHQLTSKTIIRDELLQIRATVSRLVAEKICSFIIVTGGTGLTERDVTPEALAPLYSKAIPGFGELFRYLSYSEIGTATIQSRAEAGLCGHVVIFALPGSTGACRLALRSIILPQIDNTQGPCNFRGVIPEPQ